MCIDVCVCVYMDTYAYTDVSIYIYTSIYISIYTHLIRPATQRQYLHTHMHTHPILLLSFNSIYRESTSAPPSVVKLPVRYADLLLMSVVFLI